MVAAPVLRFLRRSGTVEANLKDSDGMEDKADLSHVDSRIDFQHAADYWDSIDATVNGMLGGFGEISEIDIEGSNKFLKSLFKTHDGLGRERALDCGAGIGRITKHLLQRHFNRVDLVEQNHKFLEKAKEYLQESKAVGELICTGLQDFTPKPATYDVIWCQWVLGHLPDQHLESFLQRCRNALNPGGIIVVKENLTSSGELEFDECDSSVTRSEQHLMALFDKSGLQVIRIANQQKFPTKIYPVKMFALK